jgi:hypothetical protein
VFFEGVWDFWRQKSASMSMPWQCWGEAVDESRDASGTWKDGAPLFFCQIGGDDCGLGFVPTSDNVVTDVGRAVVAGAGQIAKLISDQNVRGQIALGKQRSRAGKDSPLSRSVSNTEPVREGSPLRELLAKTHDGDREDPDPEKSQRGYLLCEVMDSGPFQETAAHDLDEVAHGNEHGQRA